MAKNTYYVTKQKWGYVIKGIDLDEGPPDLTPEEYDALYRTMGGAQTNAFIETAFADISKDTCLPGGVHIPSPDYLELETHGCKTYQKVMRSVWNRETGKDWDRQIAASKTVTPKVLNTILQKSPSSPPFEVSILPMASMGRTQSRESRLQQLKKIRETARYCIWFNDRAVSVLRHTL